MLYRSLTKDELQMFLSVCKDIRKEQNKRTETDPTGDKSKSMRIWVEFTSQRANLNKSDSEIKNEYTLKFSLIEKGFLSIHATQGVYIKRYISLTNKGAKLVEELREMNK
ncbi:hypothetical protein [Rossellomorea marisflavi]|uniref:hypothetical protein n=1 Tax=Rossellomorea marisflavi TaxID=189381 RepID=UPI003FA04A82